MLEDEERAVDDNWFDDLDSQVCAFKRKTINWVNIARKKQHASRHSSRSSRSWNSIYSKRSSESKGSRSSTSLPRKKKYIEDMEKMAELLAEAVEKKIEDPCGRLTPLIKYTTGEVRRT